MRSTISRRDFLRVSASLAVGVMTVGCVAATQPAVRHEALFDNARTDE
jgi:hypothetical protein